ncbi:MAG: protein kinase [bacterium]|nr:protein kinase [bacterium]
MDKNRLGADYFVFEKLGIDSVGQNFRAVKLEKNSPLNHHLLTEVHPFLTRNPQEWNRANILMERFKKEDFPSLYCPQEIIKMEGHTLLQYPYLECKTLDQIVKDSNNKEMPIKFTLAFSIAMAIINLIEVGAAIAGSDHALHGFLTPDNILIDYYGNVYLKYFGIWPFYNENEEAFAEMVRKYGAWLTPEFIRREKIVLQSDLYHLGYMVYRMLTGNYFSYLPGEDFESTFTSISFKTHLPSMDIDYLTELIDFFKMTLNPDIGKRFATIDEFKKYILDYFEIEDMVAFRSSMATYMQSLYADSMKEEERVLKEELAYDVPEEGKLEQEEGKLEQAEAKLEQEEVPEPEHIHAIDEEKKFPLSKFTILIFAIIAVVAFGATYFSNYSTKQSTVKEKEVFEKKLAEVNKKLENLETRKKNDEQQNVQESGTTDLSGQDINRDDENKSPSISKKDVTNLPKTRSTNNLNSRVKKKSSKKEHIKKSTVVSQKNKPPVQQGKKVKPVKKQNTPPISGMGNPKIESNAEEKKVRKEKVRDRPRQELPPVSLKEVSRKPKKISGKAPKFSDAIKKSYVGRRATVRARLLINEKGAVVKVDILSGKIPADIGNAIKRTLITWKYTPAKKDNNAVKVWLPVKIKIFIEIDR